MVCMLRCGGHVGGQEQRVTCHFYANFVNKFPLVLSTKMVAVQTSYSTEFYPYSQNQVYQAGRRGSLRPF